MYLIYLCLLEFSSDNDVLMIIHVYVIVVSSDYCAFCKHEVETNQHVIL